MCGSEPCRHEREFAGTQQDTLTSFVKTNRELVKITAERDAALAALVRVRNLIDPKSEAARPMYSVFTKSEIRAALEPTPKGTK